MNTNQNNIQRQQENKLKKRQPLSFQAVKIKKPRIVPSRYKKHHLKFLKRHACIYGIAKAALLYQIIESLQHKKFYEGTQLIYVDYSKKVLSMMVEGLLSPYQVGQFLKQLNEEGVITLRKKHGYSIRGNRIHRGRNFMHDYTGMETGIFCVEDAKALSVNAAYLMTRVKQSCKQFNKKMKAGYLNPTTTYDIVSSDHIHDLCNGVLTESQVRKSRALLTKNNLLHKSRSRNKKFGKMTTNKWVYSTNIDALKTYQTSKKANWRYTDKELNTYNELGINLSTALYLQRQNTTPVSCGYTTHNPEIDNHSNKLYKPIETLNHMDGFLSEFEFKKEELVYNFDEYEKFAANLDAKRKRKRIINAIEKNKTKSHKHIDTDKYDKTKLPSKGLMMEFMMVETKATFEKAEEAGRCAAQIWGSDNPPDDWTKVLIHFRLMQERGETLPFKEHERELFMGAAPPPEFNVGNNNSRPQRKTKHKEVQHAPEKFASQESLIELREMVKKFIH